jgi:hypothetical protein
LNVFLFDVKDDSRIDCHRGPARFEPEMKNSGAAKEGEIGGKLSLDLLARTEAVSAAACDVSFRCACQSDGSISIIR